MTEDSNVIKAPSTIDLRSLKFSPTQNPFISGAVIETKRKKIRTRATPKDLLDPETGEIVGQSIIHTIEEKDQTEFVKLFADGVKMAFGLNRTASKVFQAVLVEYQKEKMTGGFADSVTLYWFGDGLNGEAIGIKERSFQNGLKELLKLGFLYPKTPNVYWVNPSLFFKGDRVAFLKEYRIRDRQTDLEDFTGS